MCIKRRTFYSCRHAHERLFICPLALSPILDDLTSFPYSVRSSLMHLAKSKGGRIASDISNHDVFMSCDHPREPCPGCVLPDLNVVTLEAEVRRGNDDRVESGSQGERREAKEEKKETKKRINGGTVADSGTDSVDGTDNSTSLSVWNELLRQNHGAGELLGRPWMERGHVVLETRVTLIDDVPTEYSPFHSPDQKRQSKL